MTTKKKKNGFTLIELMIVVAIIGILAAIAYPSYIDSVQKSRRSDATGALLGFANAMERHFTETNSYCDAADASGAAVVGCGVAGTNDTGFPTIYNKQSPLDGGTKYYNLKINAVTASTYTLYAERIATSPQANDQCGSLTLDQTGARGITGSGITATDCWK